MNYLIKSLSVLVIIMTGSFSYSFSQLSAGGKPPGYVQPENNQSYAMYHIPAPEVTQLLSEDELHGKTGVAERIGVMLPVDISLSADGTWHYTHDGKRQWRSGIRSEGASHLALYFEDFYLPPGYGLFVYNESKTRLLGAFTHLNNHESGLFATEMIPGEALVVELIAERGSGGQARFTITDVLYAYKDQDHQLKQFGKSGACNVNVMCSEGVGWQDHYRGIVKIHTRVGNSVYRCSGSLVNNTSYDFLPYVFTADHCARNNSGQYSTESDLNQWMFYFNYESETCENPSDEPSYVSTTGASLKANVGGGSVQMGSDFCLVLLNDEIPPAVRPYYNGWSHIDVPSPSGVGIHHPSGDIKKISTYTNPLITASWNSYTPNMYWEMRWSPTQNGHGVTEGGSSGSPLFSNDGYIVGQLTGGQASCANPNAPDYYGKFAVSWESNGTTPDRQLKPWLDPANTGVQTLRGTYNELQVIAGFIADTIAIQTGGSIGFSDISIGDPTQWHWIFEGGEPNESFQKDPGLITYNRFGKYDVTLIVSNDHYTDTLVRENYIQIVPGIFPNPAIDYVTMLLGDHNEQLLVLEITDIAGRPFGTYEYKISNAYSIKIDTTPLVSGMYVITASFGNNFFSRQKLFVTR